MSAREQKRADYAWLMPMQTRWADNDRYNHMNNAVYYSVFENVVMNWLELENTLDLHSGDTRVFTVENGCQYHASVRHPDSLECGLRVAKLGNSSVRYELGIFVEGNENVAATGFIVDVFVDADSEKPKTIPDAMRQVLQALLMESG